MRKKGIGVRSWKTARLICSFCFLINTWEDRDLLRPTSISKYSLTETCEIPRPHKHQCSPVQKTAVGPRQHSRTCFRAPSGPMTIFLFFPTYSRVLKLGLLFDERRGLTSAGHSPSKSYIGECNSRL
jgi:hypothetical protein